MGTDFRTWEADNVDGITAGQNYFKRGKATRRPMAVSTTALTSTGTLAAVDQRLWGVTNTNTLSLTTTTSNVITGEYVYNISSQSFAVNGTIFTQTPTFKLSRKLLGKPVTVSFDYADLTAAGAADVVAVRYNSSGVWQEDIAISGTASSTTATVKSAVLSSGLNAFSGFFISGSSSASDIYALRFRWLTTAFASFNLDNIIVGTQTSVAGAAITDWQSYTPTFTNITVTASSLWQKRSTDSIRIAGYFDTSSATAASCSVSFPTGVMTDFTKQGGVAVVRGKWWNNFATGSAKKTGTIYLESASSNNFYFSWDDYTTAQSPSTNLLGSQLNQTGGTVRIYVDFEAPIANWSSNVTMADRALEEFASNSSTTVTTDTTSFANGINGSLIPQGTASGSFDKTIQFQTPIQATDTLILELNPGTGWAPLTSLNSDLDIQQYQRQNTFFYGVYCQPLTSTTARVRFGRYRNTSNAAYGDPGLDWGSSSIRYRVRKVSGGAQVGSTAISARNIVGDVSGTVVPSGFIGQKITWVSAPTTQALTTSYVDWTNANLSLTAGIWMIVANVNVQMATQSGAASDVEGHVQIVDGSGTLVELQRKRTRIIAINTVQVVDWKTLPFSCIVRPTATTTYKIQARKQDNLATSTANLMNGVSSTDYSEFYAIRIA